MAKFAVKQRVKVVGMREKIRKDLGKPLTGTIDEINIDTAMVYFDGGKREAVHFAFLEPLE